MLVCVQWMRRLVGSVFFSMMFLFGILSTNVLAVDSQKAAQANIVYTVKAGDTLYGIALEYGVTLQQLVTENILSSQD